jgi:hypothetical protein
MDVMMLMQRISVRACQPSCAGANESEARAAHPRKAPTHNSQPRRISREPP